MSWDGKDRRSAKEQILNMLKDVKIDRLNRENEKLKIENKELWESLEIFRNRSK